MDPSRPLPVRQLHRLWSYCAVGVVLAGGVFWWAFRPDPIAPQLKALREAGYPVSLEELNAWYPAVPEADNAAVVLEEAFARFTADDKLRSLPLAFRNRLPDPAHPLPDELKSEIAGLVDENRAALDLIHAALQRPKCRYPIDLSEGLNTQLPHLTRISRVAQLLVLKAIVEAEENDLQDAVESLADSLKLARTLSDEPLLVSQMVRVGRQSTAVEGLEWILNRHTLSDRQIVLLQQAFAEADAPEALARGLTGERACGIAVFQLPREKLRQLTYFNTGPSSQGTLDAIEELFSSSAFALGHGFRRVSGLSRRDFQYYLDTMASNIAIASRPYPEQIWTMDRANSELGEELSSHHYFLSGMMLPELSRSISRTTRSHAAGRLAQLALAIERYRLAHGNSPPEKLDDLAPQWIESVPLDPFLNKPFHYQKRGEGFVLYSVGSNMKDDGGVRGERWPQNPGPDDIAFAMRR